MVEHKTETDWTDAGGRGQIVTLLLSCLDPDFPIAYQAFLDACDILSS